MPCDDSIGLEEFVSYVDAHLDTESTDSLLAIAPKLLALSRNRRFLADFLRQNIVKPDFQTGNTYLGPVLLLAVGDRYLVRALAWPPEEQVEPTPSGARPSTYHGKQLAAHNHNAHLLTVGYWGPGYETDIWECEPETVTREIGAPVNMHYKGRFCLSPHTVLFYEAHRHIHLQYPPKEFSISLNLITRRRCDEQRDQFYVDLTDNTIAGVTSPGNLGRRLLLELAEVLPDPRLKHPFLKIATTNPAPSLRHYAKEVVDHFLTP